VLVTRMNNERRHNRLTARGKNSRARDMTAIRLCRPCIRLRAP
jgi:hypothetical protein